MSWEISHIVEARITPQNRSVIEARYFKCQTLELTGKQLNYTRERIRQIEHIALRQLRHPKQAQHLIDFLK